MKKIIWTSWLLLIFSRGFGQVSFLDQQLKFPRVWKAYQAKESVLQHEFKQKGLIYPAKYLYIRAFKLNGELEVWVKNNLTDTFSFFKAYHICAFSGSPGPKRELGDNQIPEGFYYIDRFNPESLYHLSLGINYPNTSDKILGNTRKIGGNIYIHGSCSTEGCIPLTDQIIEEVYVLAIHAKNEGQDFIPVHIFPTKFNQRQVPLYSYDINMTPVSVSHKENLADFWKQLQVAYEYFEKNKQIPIVLIDGKGKYIL